MSFTVSKISLPNLRSTGAGRIKINRFAISRPRWPPYFELISLKRPWFAPRDGHGEDRGVAVRPGIEDDCISIRSATNRTQPRTTEMRYLTKVRSISIRKPYLGIPRTV